MDFTIVSPDAPTNARRAGDESNPLLCAVSAAGSKIAKYQELVETAGDVFCPVVYNTSGSYLQSTDMVVKRIALAGIENDVPRPVTAAYIRMCAAVVIQRGNALANIECASRMRSKLKPNPALAEFRRKRRIRARAMVANTRQGPNG
jgi:hypothetical protein